MGLFFCNLFICLCITNSGRNCRLYIYILCVKINYMPYLTYISYLSETTRWKFELDLATPHVLFRMEREGPKNDHHCVSFLVMIPGKRRRDSTTDLVRFPLSVFPKGSWRVYGWMDVCEREREREREKLTEWKPSFFLTPLSLINVVNIDSFVRGNHLIEIDCILYSLHSLSVFCQKRSCFFFMY